MTNLTSGNKKTIELTLDETVEILIGLDTVYFRLSRELACACGDEERTRIAARIAIITAARAKVQS